MILMTEGLDNLAGAVGDTLKTAPTFYEDALQPATQESGKILALIPRAVNAALVPLHKWIAEREYNLAETEKLLAQKLEHVGEDKIVTPDPYVAVPAIQAISYSMDSESLRNLYANLLANAMNLETKNSVHPAYIETIKQLSPDDASYFKYICPLQYRPMIDVILDLPNALTITISENSNLFSTGHVENFGLTLDNLSRLGLIKIPNGIWYGDDNIYEQLLTILKTEYTLETFLPSQPDATGISYNKKRIDITSYGKSFYDTCCI